MNLYVMRHGTTVWNEKGITQGRTNNRLSKEGVALTKNVAKNLKDVPFNIIISSPLTRTIQTANIINLYHKVKVVKDCNLIEINQGIFTGRSKDSLTKQEQILKNSRSKSAGMESYQECYNRIKNFIENIKHNYNYENVLIITHKCCAYFIEAVVCSKTIDFNSMTFNNPNFLRSFKNAEVKKFVI